MVQQYFDPHYYHLGGNPMRRTRQYPAPPLEVRLANWLQRAYTNSAFMRTRSSVTELRLKKSLAEKLGLPDSLVTISDDGVLRHQSRSEPLACIR